MTDTFPIDRVLLADAAQTFARFPSQQTDLFESEPQVQEFLGGPVLNVLGAHGLPWRQDEMGNVIVELGDGTSPSLMIMAYAMTHPANRMPEPFAGERDSNRIRGRGLAEQKGALAAAIAAVAASRDLPLAGRLTLTITSAGETGRHDAARAVLAAMDHVPDAVVIAIGTSGRLALANKGRLDVESDSQGTGGAFVRAPWPASMPLPEHVWCSTGFCRWMWVSG